MSYTNKTANYELPQYAPDDKPTYLGDFNQAMLKIDTTMKSIDAKSESAETNSSNANATASEALETASSASSLANTANTSAGEAKTMAQNAQSDASSAISTANSASSTAQSANETASSAKSTAESANSTATSAKTTAESNSQKITNIKKWVDCGNIGSTSYGNVYCKYNKELSLLSLYGSFNFLLDNPNNIILGTLPEEIRPSKTRTIVGVLTPIYPIGTAGNGAGVPADLVINSQGQIVLYNNGIGAPSRLNYGKLQGMLCISDWFDDE